MRLAFAGSPPAAATVLRHLVSTPHEVVLVVTQPDRRRGRSSRPRATAVAEAALGLGIPVRRPASINDDEMLAELRQSDVAALVVVAFGQILRAPLLSEWLCLNVHFSLLPAYRGAAPVERAIMDGVAKTGVTIMRMDQGLDTGPVADRAVLAIGVEETAGHLTERLAEVGGPLLAAALDAAEGGELRFTPQPEDGISLAPRIGAEDRPLDVERTARALADHVRSLAPHIGATLAIGGETFKVWSAIARPGDTVAGPIEAVDGRLLVRCADGAIEVVEIQPPGRARMPVDSFLRGRRGDLSAEA